MHEIVNVTGRGTITRSAWNTIMSCIITIQLVGVLAGMTPAIAPMLFFLLGWIGLNINWKDRYILKLGMRTNNRVRQRRFVLLGDTSVMTQTVQAIQRSIRSYP